MDCLHREAIKRAIFDIVRIIPRGRATTYGAIAKAIGYPNSARIVGRIMSEASSESELIAAHRVVASQGILSAKKAFGCNNEMQKLLEAEGLIIVNDRIKNWAKVFWDPITEIHL